MLIAVLLLFASVPAHSQGISVQAAPEEKNTIIGSYRGAYRKQVFVGPTDQVFPHIATGGGWETVIVILNMGSARVDFRLRFYGQDGRPLAVTFRDYPDLNMVTTSAAVGFLGPNASFNFALFDSTPDTRVGWASLDYDSTGARMGGYAIFRQRVPGRPDYEALVPLSAYDDYKFYMPFDNIQGFVTAMALVNPASNLSSRITITAFTLRGVVIDRIVITLPPGGQTAFVLADRFPAFANTLGTLYVESDTTRMSALGLRFNTAGGNAFSSIPILNWGGMFP
ncbi:MAG: hypothetical protein HYX72_12920 [Acidobacteria bacterium]|nr:hypothetical protein [Acidobacteriota bacterium]